MIDWQRAWQAALYGDGGFYLRGPGPAAHFRTASHAAPGALAAAIARLARDESCTEVLEIAAGRGELAAALAARAPELPVTALDLVPRPDGLPPAVAWVQGSAPGDAVAALNDPSATGRVLVMAWEWLDVVPCPVVEVDEDGVPRVVLVDPRTGAEKLGDPPGPADQAWLDAWWPPARTEHGASTGYRGSAQPGDRAEVGRPRDEAWTALVTGLRARGLHGALLAVDYDHDRTARPPGGSLSGFRAGRQVPPRPDGSCDLTAHVALDAVQAAGERAGATTVTLTRQATALRALGVSGGLGGGLGGGPGGGPGGEVGSCVAGTDELLDLGGLGGFGWLLQRF